MTLRLCAQAVESWMDIDGWALARGLDLMSLPLGRFVNVIWHRLTLTCEDEQALDQLRIKLWMPVTPEEEISVGPWAPDAEMAAFRSLKTAFGQ